MRLLKEGTRLEKEGKSKEALVAMLKYRKLLEQEGEDEETVATANMFKVMGGAFWRQGEYAEAEKYFAKELALQQRLLVPPDDVSFGHLNTNMGKLYLALEYHAKALEISIAALGEKHPSVAITYRNMGLVYEKKNDKITALTYFRKALAIIKEMLGDSHPDTINSVNDVDRCSQKMIHMTRLCF